MFRITGLPGTDIPYSTMKFSGGEIQVRLDGEISNKEVIIRGNITSSDEIMELMLVVDAMRRNALVPFTLHLTCPYLPYARQDRVCADGEALSLRVMCDLLNSLKFDSVTVWDVHSDVALALLNNINNVPQKYFVHNIPRSASRVLVSPDAGAVKKTLDIAKSLKLPMIQADKIRSTDDGSITGTRVHSEHVGSKDFLIVDDICDGGRTFIELAKVLRPLTDGKIYLYVTHGIFSKGLRVFNHLIDHIYVANPFPGVDLDDPILTTVGNLIFTRTSK